MAFQHKQDVIGRFAQHPVAANLLMIMMALAGFWGFSHINVQMFPTLGLDFVNVRTVWSGATAEDMEQAVTAPLEDNLRVLPGVQSSNSWSYYGASSIWLEFEKGSDMGKAQDDINEAISRVTNLPASAEEPQIVLAEFRETVARVVVANEGDINQIRALIKQFEQELLDAGMAQVTVLALPQEEIAIQVPQTRLVELGLSIDQLAQMISSGSVDFPAGTVGNEQAARQLRSSGQLRNVDSIASMPLIADRNGRMLTVGDIAKIERRPVDGQVRMWHKKRTAVELVLYRTKEEDTLQKAQILNDWYAKTLPNLPPGVDVVIYDQQWQLVEGRIKLLLENGLGGLVLIIIILFLFMNGRVAFWVTVGIPISFLATLMVLYLAGGTINMISLFALIMALGIIVDDAIVVGEDALAHYQKGENSLEAAEGGARRMFWPVMSSSMTTVAAFMPLMLLTGYIGDFLFAIPLVIICVIIASIIECFVILPGHLRHTFHKMQHAEPGKTRQRLDGWFERFKERRFKPLLAWSLRHRRITLSTVLAMFILSLGLLTSGRIGFSFMPTPEGTLVIGNIGFLSGTPRERVEDFLQHAEEKLWETDQELGPGLVDISIVRSGVALVPGTAFTRSGDQYGLFQVELISSDARDIRNDEFTQAWYDKLTIPPGLEDFTFDSIKPGGSGLDIEVRIAGHGVDVLKQAAQDLQDAIKLLPGTLPPYEDTPFGREQFIYKLSAEGHSLGLNTTSIGRQLRAAFEGAKVQSFQERGAEVEVRVQLPNVERNQASALDVLPIILPAGNSALLGNVVNWQAVRGVERLRHADGKLAITVSANVDAQQANANQLRQTLARDVLPRLSQQYGVEMWLTGQAEEQAKTFSEMLWGTAYALALIYLVLAWVFGSWGWPLLVMAIMPLGLVGALLGHWLLGIDMTILSMFGFFGLSGIVVNDSIILVVFYRELRASGMPINKALLEAGCQRLRAVMLTSLTTIAGLIPLLFETSLQAQFLIPMATSMAFGLAFATVLVLLIVPVLLSVYEELMAKYFPGPAPHLPDNLV